MPRVRIRTRVTDCEASPYLRIGKDADLPDVVLEMGVEVHVSSDLVRNACKRLHKKHLRM